MLNAPSLLAPQVNSQHVDLTHPGSKTTKRITVHFTGRVRIDAL